jgi:hypothetical protein
MIAAPVTADLRDKSNAELDIFLNLRSALSSDASEIWPNFSIDADILATGADSLSTAVKIVGIFNCLVAMFPAHLLTLLVIYQPLI